jgi:ADP-ribose pyrophosphatase
MGTVTDSRLALTRISMPDDLAWKTLEHSIDYECPGFAVRRDSVTLPDGRETDFHVVEDADTVVILPFTPDGDVVLVEEWRQAVDRVARGLPAGGIESEDDSIVAAARRELAEETGYEAGSIEPLTSAEPANGVMTTTNHYVVARDCRPTGEQDLDPNESIRVETTGLADLRGAVREGEIGDGRTALAVQRHWLEDLDPEGANGR